MMRGTRRQRPLQTGAVIRIWSTDESAFSPLNPRFTPSSGLIDITGECLYEAELYRLQGDLTLQSDSLPLAGRVNEAEACFQKALEAARQQSAKSLELRAAMSLARLWRSQGKQAQARDILAPVYDWFTEGFDTTDLKDAKALLTELSEGV